MKKWKVDSRAFAYWEEDGYWYPATITQVDGDDIEICYDYDNEKEVVTEDYLVELSVAEGDEVESWSAANESFYLATIKEIQGDRILVEYENGITEWTDLTKLRVSGDWQVDDGVFAYWEDDGYWYPATIIEIDGDEITIEYDSGEEEITNGDYLIDLYVEVGDEVESLWEKDDKYYAATVLEVRDEDVLVKYEDGSTEWSNYERLRLADQEE